MAELYPGKFCRLRRTLQPLYDACLHVRLGSSGSSYWHDHLGTYWRGMDTSACVRPPKPGEPSEEVVCHQDSGNFSANDEEWLRIARPFVAEELRAAPDVALLAPLAGRGAPSLDRLLLLLARLACLSDTPPAAGLLLCIVNYYLIHNTCIINYYIIHNTIYHENL